MFNDFLLLFLSVSFAGLSCGFLVAVQYLDKMIIIAANIILLLLNFMVWFLWICKMHYAKNKYIEQ